MRRQMSLNQLVTEAQPTFDAVGFDVCERHAIEITPGDKLLLTANRRESDFRVTNGEIVTVHRIDSKKQVHLTDGRILPPHFRQFTHGYAVTAHRSQGKSVASVIISADGMQKELFYVAASRGREKVLVITSDKQTLSESVGRSNARQSASELARGARPGLYQGLDRGFQAACNLARWAAQYVREWSSPAAEPTAIPEPAHTANNPMPEKPSPPVITPSAPAKEPVGPVEKVKPIYERRAYDLEIER